MSNFIKECNEVTDDIRKKANMIDDKEVEYILKMYHTTLNELEDQLNNNSDQIIEIIARVANRLYKKVNTMTYATVVYYFVTKLQMSYVMYVGFSCLNKDRQIYEHMQRDLSSHPFPVNHIYFDINKHIYECFVQNDKRYYTDIVHADNVLAARN